MLHYVPGMGDPHARLMIIGEAPGKDEDEAGIPFVGQAGEVLNDLLRQSDIMRSECYITNVVKYRPPFNKLSRLLEIGISLEKEIENLWTEIRSIKPNCILALGETALNAVTGKKGITKYRGSILRSKFGDFKIVPTFHPAAFLYHQETEGVFKYSYYFTVINDMRRALSESRHSRFELPDRYLHVAQNSLDVHRFLREYEKNDKLVTDIEAISCMPICIGMAFNSYEGLSVPLFREINGIKLTDMSYDELTECWQMIAKTLNEKKVIGQNIKYDDGKLSALGFKLNVYADTGLYASIVDPETPEKSLGYLASVYTREPYYKDEGKDFNPKRDNISKFLIYNARDCPVTYEVFEGIEKEAEETSEEFHLDLKKYFYDFQMKLYPIYLGIERIGLNVDLKQREFLISKYIAQAQEVESRITEYLSHPLNVNSPIQVFQTLFRELRIPERKDVGEDTLVALMANTVKDVQKKDLISNILEARRVRKTLSNALGAALDFDGRFKTNYRLNGTETGRTSTSNLRPPLRPWIYTITEDGVTKTGKVKRKKLKRAIGFPFHTLSKHGDIGADIRTMLIPDPGYIFANIDLSQAEARIVSILARDDEMLRMFDERDIHSFTTSFVFDIPIEKITKESPERFVGKILRHACSYGMHKHRFMLTAMSEGRRAHIPINISEWRADQLITKFHRLHPKIREVFHEDIKSFINENRYLIRPDGSIRFFRGRNDERLFQEAFADIPQHTVRQVIGYVMIQIKSERPDIQILGESHDALFFQLKESQWKEDAKYLMGAFRKEIDFSKCSLPRGKLIIPADIEVGENYKDLRKVSLT